MLASQPEAIRNKILADLTEPQLQALAYDWRFWGRPEQLPPPGKWLTWLVLAGRGFGKTRTGSEFVRAEVKAGRARHIAIIAETAADARDVLVEGPAGILACHPPHERPNYEPSKRRLTWPNGAVASLFNATEPDQLRGPNFDLAWCDEAAKWQYAQETWDQLQFALRIGEHPRQIVTTTPRPIPLIKALVKAETTVTTSGATFENAANLAPSFIKSIKDRYAGTRLGRQELLAQILDDVPGALWTRETIDKARARVELPDMVRVVVAVDPSGAGSQDDEKADAIGIVVAGKGVDGRGYVLADRTCKLSPAGWGRRAVDAYHEFRADRIVAERNYGGAMVQHVIRTTDPKVAYKEVVASRGKILRAEPIAGLYEQGKVSHVGDLDQLEDQLCQMCGDGYLGDGSPDRADALVWALTELMLGYEMVIPIAVPLVASRPRHPIPA